MFFSEAIALIEPKLCINHWKVLYKLCVFYVDRNSKMTTTAGHSFYIGPIGSFYNQVNDTGSWEPLVFLNVIFCFETDNSMQHIFILHPFLMVVIENSAFVFFISCFTNDVFSVWFLCNHKNVAVMLCYGGRLFFIWCWWNFF